MFTRCPACRTVFYITAAELKAADGAVVCGNCDTNFDALESLSETRPETDTPPADEETSAPADEETSRAEEEAESEAGDRARDEHEFLEEVESLIGRDDVDDDIPDPDSVFMVEEWPPEPTPEAAQSTPGSTQDSEQAEPDSDQAPLPEAPEQPPVPLLIAQTPDDPASNEAPPRADARPGGAPAESGAAPDVGPPVDFGREAPDPDAAEAGSFTGFEEERPSRRRWWRIAMPVAAFVILVLAWAHSQRGQLLRHDTGQALLGTIYRVFGVDAVPDWEPGELIVLRSEAVADTGQPGNLRVAVEFRNAASFAQPYPVIRVVLQDRFGQRVGQRDVAPVDYLRDPADPPRMAAGERVQATVSVPDPGARADGFRISLCLDMPPRGLVCTAEPLR